MVSTCALGGSASRLWTLWLDGPDSRSDTLHWTVGTWRKEEAWFSAGIKLRDSCGFFLASANGCMLRSRCVVFCRNLLVDEVFVLEDEIDLGRGRRALQLLTIQHLVLQLLDSLSNRNVTHTRGKLFWRKKSNFSFFSKFYSDPTLPVFTKASATLRLRPP